MEIAKYLPSDLFKDKNVFVTGGGSGINLGIARNFAALGARVGICGRTPEKLESAQRDLKAYGTDIYTFIADVCDYDQIALAISQMTESTDALDCLICGAAGNFLAPAQNLSPVGFKKVVEIDLVGSFNAARAAFEPLRKAQGSIVFISAGQSMSPYFAQAHVGAAKAGVDNLMRSLALEWGPYGIRSNSIIPGPIEGTEGMKRLAPGNSHRDWCQEVPLRRFGTVDNVAHMAIFLASPLASYVTGSCVTVDGGQNLPGSGVFSRIIADSMSSANM